MLTKIPKWESKLPKNPGFCVSNLFGIFEPLENWGENTEKYTKMGTKTAENPRICASKMFAVILLNTNSVF